MSALVTRRRFIRSAAALGGAVAFPYVARGAEAGEISFGLTPVFLTNDLELLAKLRAFLARTTGRAVQLVQRRTYQEITALLLSGQLSGAWICGYPYVRYREHLQLLAVPIWLGKPLYRSYVIVDKQRAGESFDDLRGDIHAYSDPDSNSGFLVTTALLAEMGLRPPDFFSSFFYAYGHRNVVRAVSSGLAQSGSVDGYVYEVLREVEPALTEPTRVLRKSEWLGFPPIAAPAEPRDPEATELLTQALLRMDKDESGREILKMLRLDKFEREAPEMFDRIAHKFEQVQRLG